MSFLEKRPAKFTGNMARDAPSAYPWWQPVEINRKARVRVEGSKL